MKTTLMTSSLIFICLLLTSCSSLTPQRDSHREPAAASGEGGGAICQPGPDGKGLDCRGGTLFYLNKDRRDRSRPAEDRCAGELNVIELNRKATSLGLRKIPASVHDCARSAIDFLSEALNVYALIITHKDSLERAGFNPSEVLERMAHDLPEVSIAVIDAIHSPDPSVIFMTYSPPESRQIQIIPSNLLKAESDYKYVVLSSYLKVSDSKMGRQPLERSYERTAIFKQVLEARERNQR